MDLGFLDFSTIAARERFARREFALNTGSAPGLYRGVLAVTRDSGGGLELGGAGPVVDWIVCMARVPAGDFLAAVAAAGGLDPGLLDATADAVAAMHAGLPGLTDLDPVAASAAVIEGNAAAAVRAGLAAAAWAASARAELARIAPTLVARAAAGRVRRCHGDLHLGNLCLWQGRPTPFDALEFNEALARIDTGYDFAFLLMDLELRVGRAAANRVLNRYVARTGDAGLVAGLPLWLSLRAMIRAHVAAAQGKCCARLVAFAAAALVASPARRVAIGGLMGSGKSSLARRLAPGLGAAPGAVVLRSDEIRKRLAGVAPEVLLPPAAYGAAASAAVFAQLLADARAVGQAGHAVIADAVFLDPADRAAIAAGAGAGFLGLWLTAPPSVLRARVAARQGDASDATVAVLDAAIARHGLAPPAGWVAIDATEDPLPGALAALNS